MFIEKSVSQPSLFPLPVGVAPIDFKQAAIKEVSKDCGKSFIMKYHNLHDILASHTYLGLFSDDLLLGVAAYNSGPFPNFGKMMSKKLYGNKEVWSLCRLCCADYAPKFSESVLISRCTKYIKRNFLDIKLLVTYVTASEGEVGIAWQATNWLYIGPTNARSGNVIHRYLFPLESKTKKELINRWSNEIKPYPKRSER